MMVSESGKVTVKVLVEDIEHIKAELAEIAERSDAAIFLEDKKYTEATAELDRNASEIQKVSQDLSARIESLSKDMAKRLHALEQDSTRTDRRFKLAELRAQVQVEDIAAMKKTHYRHVAWLTGLAGFAVAVSIIAFVIVMTNL